MKAFEWRERYPEDVAYFEYCQHLKDGHEIEFFEAIHNSNSYAGYVNISRTLAFYELYKMVINLNGHIADVGVYKGNSLFLFAKLCQIFEPHSHTTCHGFDWFRGMSPGENDHGEIPSGSYRSDKNELMRLISLQQLDNLIYIHDLDLRTEIENFFSNAAGLRFKLVSLDVGLYDVVSECLPLFYEHLVPGGVMIFDQISMPDGEGEAVALVENFPDLEVHSLPFARSPSGYIIKRSR